MSAALAPGWRVEIRLLAADPGDEPAELGMGPQGRGLMVAAFQLLVIEMGVDGAVADRMHGDGLAPAPAPGHGMVPFDAAAERPSAQEAGRRIRSGQRLSQWDLRK